MSGPWDRQPSPEPDDEWPSEDLGRRDAWSTAEPSRDAARDAAPGWDDWPAPPPPADDYLIEEPLRPSSDPWAESWTDEAASGPAPTWSGERADAAGPRVEPWSPDADPWGLPAADATWREPSSEAAPEPEPEPTPREARLEAPSEAAPRQAFSVESPPVDAPPVEASLEEIPVEAGAPQPPQVAWSPPEVDAWSPVDEIETDTDEALPDDAEEIEAAGSAAWPGEPPSIFRAPEPEPEPPGRTRWFAPAETAGEAADAGWRETIFPAPEPAAGVAEPEDESRTAAVIPPEVVAAPPGEEAAQDIEEHEHDAPDALEATPMADAEVGAEAEPESAGASRFNPLRWLSGRATGKPETEPAEPQPGVDAPAADAAEVEASATTAPPVEAPQPEPAPEVEADADAEPDAGAEATAPAAALPSDAWEPDAALDWQPASGSEVAPETETPMPADDGWSEPWPVADVAAMASASVPAGAPMVPPDGTEAEEPEPSSSSAEDLEPPSWAEPAWRAEPEPDWRSEAVAPEGPGLTAPAVVEPEPEPEPVVPEPEPEPAWRSEPTWPEASESTQVLPSTWAPTVPEPRPAEPSLAPSAGEIRTRLSAADADEDAEPATSTAEQAVPWLIGVILLLAGMVIVLLALIFAGDASLAGAQPDPSATQLAVVDATGSAEPTRTPSATPVATSSAAPSASTAPSSTPVAMPDYGPLEMVYQGRSAALAAIYLLHRDFTTEDEPEVLAQDATLDVRRFAWSPDGRHGAGLLADVLVSIEPGADKRRLGDGIDTITFGSDPETLYAVRVTQDGANDVAAILAIDFTSGDSTELASVTYTRPSLESEAAVNEAQFADDGGGVRLYWMHDGSLRLWVLGAGAWDIDPQSGDATEQESQDVPWLWDPDGRHRISYAASSGTTTLTLLGRSGEEQATTTVEGLVSHLRWSPDGKRVVFTLGRSTSAGGVLQDLFLWDLGDGQAPVQLTNTGAAFGAQWLGTVDRFQEATPDA